jgi:hypothetical protein
MNHYKHALVKEVAAQRAGYEPSPVWGKITHNNNLIAPLNHYEAIMNSDHPLEIPRSKAFEDVNARVNNYIKGLPKSGIIKKEMFGSEIH